MIMPGGNAIVSVECTPESDVPRKFEEVREICSYWVIKAIDKFQEILIDIADKNPIEHPQGLIYKLKSELIVPQIDTNDTSSMFEEHRIVRNLSSFQNIADVNIFLDFDFAGKKCFFCSQSLEVFMVKKNVVFNFEM